ncbi:MAG TPA: hypothetical protein VGF48_23150 [Thermoanaerobaculia bacterium]
MDEETKAMVPLESDELSEAEASRELAVRTPHELTAVAAKVMDLIAKRLELETPHPSTARRVRGARFVPREFVLSMMAAAERRPDLYPLGKFDSAKAREVLEAADAQRLLAERTAMFLASLHYTIEARWAEVAADALHCFRIASILAGDEDRPELAAEVENLKRQLGRKGGRKKKVPETAEKPE